jgi:outer membrane biosynthesis protein TonB
MNSGFKVAALVLVTALVAGCRHKTQETPPPAAQAPIIPVSTLAKNAPPPQMPPPELPKINPPGSTNAAPAPKPKPKKPVRHKPKTTEQAPAETATKDQNTEQASNGAAADVSPIGQLSAAGEGINAPRHRQIFDEINATEKGLNEIKRPLSQDEQTTASQIRTFLAKAKDALKQEDLDAANSLVTRAKVLLTELTKT